MNPRQVQLVKPIFLPRLTGIILLWLSLSPWMESAAATNAPGWKNIRIIGGSANAVIPRMGISKSSNLVYVASMTDGGVIEGTVQVPSNRSTILSIYDPKNSLLLVQLQPKASPEQYRAAWNVLAPLDDGSMVYVSMDEGDNLSTAIIKKWTGINPAEFTSKQIQGRSIGAPEQQFSAAMSDGQGGVVMMGNFSTLTVDSLSYQSLQTSGPDAFILSFDSGGNMRWLKNGVGISQDSILSGSVSPLDNSVYAGGYTTSSQLAWGKSILNNQLGSEAPFLVKHSSSGSLEWLISPKSNSISRIVAVHAATDGDLFFLGRTFSDGTSSANVLLGKCSSKGVIQWIQPAGRCWVPAPFSTITPFMKIDGMGNIYVAYNIWESTSIGGTAYRSRGGSDMLIAKFSQNGKPIWVKTAGFIGEDYITDLAVSDDSRAYITGIISSKALFDDTLVEGTYANSIFLAELQSEFSELPEITVEPLPQSIPTGKSVSFEVVTAKPAESSYQWFFNGTAITGATNSTLLISSATAADQGSYSVEIKNVYGTVRSKAAQLRIDGQVEVMVTTYAGGHGAGYVDSTNPQLVQFYRPNGLAYLSQGLIAVADEFNQVIRLVGPGGTTDTYAGNHEAGFVDAPAGLASFRSPIGLAVTPALDVLVADFNNDRIRRISAFGWRSVTTAAGNQRGYLDGDSVDAQLNAPNDLVTDASGNVYFTEFNNHTVRKLASDGRVTTFAGNGFRGQSDGIGTQAQFDHPGGIAIDRDGNLYVTEYSGLRVRKIARGGQVTTIAGSGVRGFLDGKGTNAQFNAPDGICLDPAGNLYVCEGGNHAIRKIDPQGNVVTLAGLGKAGFQDGNASRALFNSPGGLMWHPAGGLVVADTENHALRRITFNDPTVTNDDAELLISLNPTLTIFGKAGASYRIEASEDPTVATDWVTLDTITLSNGVGMWCDSQPATRKWRYYRAVKIPNP